jgi:histidinol-phosphate aminotransferase
MVHNLINLVHPLLVSFLVVLSETNTVSSTTFSSRHRQGLPLVSFVTNIIGDQNIKYSAKKNQKPSILHSSELSPTTEFNTTDTINNTKNTMTGIASKLARPNILELQPYRCARDDYSDGVLLDANENAFGPTSLPTKSLDPYDNSNTLERYPDPYQSELKEHFCLERGNGLKPSNVFVGVGSDEAIDLLMRIFCTPGGDNILITPPTYGMYKVCAKVNDVEVVSAPLTPDFDLDIPKMMEAVTEKTKLLFICSPGNPTCKAIPLSEIEKIASDTEKYPGLIVVDEAYIDFAGENSSAVALLNKYDNIVILQTLSKAFGLAGIRCGFCIGPPDVIQLMNNVKAPYNVNSLTSEVAINAMNSMDTLRKNVQSTLEERTKVRKALEALEDIVVKVYPSDSNFLLFRVKNDLQAVDVYKKMADSGVVTRFRGNELHCTQCIRVTIGTPEENEKFLELFKKTWNDLLKSA